MTRRKKIVKKRRVKKSFVKPVLPITYTKPRSKCCTGEDFTVPYGYLNKEGTIRMSDLTTGFSELFKNLQKVDTNKFRKVGLPSYEAPSTDEKSIKKKSSETQTERTEKINTGQQTEPTITEEERIKSIFTRKPSRVPVITPSEEYATTYRETPDSGTIPIQENPLAPTGLRKYIYDKAYYRKKYLEKMGKEAPDKMTVKQLKEELKK